MSSSEPQGGGPSLHVFLSYSRNDLIQATHLRDWLIDAGFGAYLDVQDILPGEPWQERLARLIEKADTVVFLLSPESVASSICDWEVNEAERLSKRILPVVIRDAGPDAIPGRLKRLNYIFLRNKAEEPEGLAELTSALLTDISWVREHTRLGELAADWERSNRAQEILLRGSPLSAAELWLLKPHSAGLAPTELHRAFISESRQGETVRLQVEREQVERTRRFQKRAGWALSSVAVVILAGAIAAVIAYWQTSKREAHVFTSKAREAFDNGNLPLALRYAVAGLPAPGALPLDYWSPELESLLANIAVRYTPMLKELTLSDHYSYGAVVRVDPATNRALVSGKDQTTLWDTHDGRVIRSFSGKEFGIFTNNRAIRFDGNSLWIMNSASGEDMVTHTGLSGFQLYHNNNGSHVFARWGNPFHDESVPPQTTLARAFSLATGEELPILKIHDRIRSDGTYIASDGSHAAFTTDSGKGYVLDLATGKAIVWPVHQGQTVQDLKLSLDGHRAIVRLDERDKVLLKIFDAQSGEEISSISIPPIPSTFGDPKYHITLSGDFVYRVTSTSGAMTQVGIPLPPSMSIDVWDLGNGTEVTELKHVCTDATLSTYESGHPPQSRAIANCNERQEILNPYTGKSRNLEHEAVLSNIIESPARNRIAVLSRVGYHLYDSFTGSEIIPESVGDTTFDPVFSPDGAILLTQQKTAGVNGSSDAFKAILRDALTGVVVSKLNAVEAIGENHGQIRVGHAAFSERGTWLATRHRNAVVLHNGRTGEEVSRVLPDPYGKPDISDVHFAGATEDRLITTHSDGSVRLWDISWLPKKGRQLVQGVCREKLLRSEQQFSMTEMEDPILAGQHALRVPCSRVGPLSWLWWLSKLGLSAKEL